MRRATLVLLALALLPFLFSRIASSFRQVSTHSAVPSDRASSEKHSRVATDPADLQNPTSTSELNSIRIAAYNIAHGRGLATSNWTGESKFQRQSRLEAIAKLLQDIDADIVVLNEVDFDSSWSGSVNQARFLANRAGYPHWVEQRNLDFRILIWTWRFGNAILSKHPIRSAHVVDLPSYAQWETLLAGKKRGVSCDVRFGDRTIRVVGLHLSHRSEQVRVESAVKVRAMVDLGATPTIIAGDLNSTPSDFPYSIADSSGRNAVETFGQNSGLQRLPDKSPIDEDQLTFHSTNPRSVIDWLLVPSSWTVDRYQVIPSKLSDHRPVSVTARISD